MYKFRVQNYQSIADAELEIDGFTVVVGPTNIGKSALVRAFKGLVENQGGDAFIRTGEVAAIVTLETEGLKIVWRKGLDSGYTIDQAGKDQQVYTSLSKGQPAFIPPLGFGEIKLGTHRVKPQIGPQFPMTPFLLQKPGSFIAEAISSVNGIDKVPPAIREADKDLRTLKSEQKVRKQHLGTAREDLTAFGGLETAATDFAAVGTLWKDIEGDEKAVEALRTLSDELGQAQARVDQYEALEGITVPSLDAFNEEYLALEALSEMVLELRHTQAQARALRGAKDIEVPEFDLDALDQEVQQLRRLSRELTAAQQAMDQYDGLAEVPEFELGDAIEEVKLLCRLLAALSSAKSAAKVSKAAAKQADADFARLDAEFNEAMGDVCLLCGQELGNDDSHTDHEG